MNSDEEQIIKQTYDNYIEIVDNESLPEMSNKKFTDICKSAKIDPLNGNYLYKHQEEAFYQLMKNNNILLASGTGSGKTESWLLFSICNNYRVLVIYPTLTLERDQYERIKKFSKVKILDKDNKTLDNDTRIVLTNPAYLMTVIKNDKGNLINFLSLVNLIVIDELTFYNTEEIQMLFKLLEIIHDKYSDFQIALLSATINNVSLLREKVSRINNRETIPIYGISFKRKNITKIFTNKLSLDNIVNSVSKLNVPTIVFVPTINLAEVFTRKIMQNSKNIVCRAHHSNLSLEDRNKIEDEFRSGKISCLVSPKTLELGIDIGTVERIVHVGLPIDPSDYFQREGRKGRRLNVKQTYTEIYPYSVEDLLILQNEKSFKEWLNLGNFGFVIPENNKYIDLFQYIYNYYRNNKRIEDKNKINQFLKNNRIKAVWRNMQFYGYGIDQYIYYVDGKKIDISISKNTLISKYLLGSLDLSYNSIINNVIIKRFGGYINGINVDNLNQNDLVNNLITYYNHIMMKYGRNFLTDFKYGRVYSESSLNVYPPNGFGFITIKPVDVVWYVELPGKKVKYGNNEIYVPKYEVISVYNILKRFVEIIYKYPTYGYKIKTNMNYREINCIAADLLIALLRQIYKIKPDEINFVAYKDNVVIWENYPSGILKHVDYSKLIDYLKSKENSLDDKLTIFKSIAYIDAKTFYYAVENNLIDVGINVFYELAKELSNEVKNEL